jgi:hypothetical protein
MAIAIRASVCVGLLSLTTLWAPGIALGNIEATAKQELSELDTERRDTGHTHLGRGLIEIDGAKFDQGTPHDSVVDRDLETYHANGSIGGKN